MESCTNKLFDVGLRNLKFKLKTNVVGDEFCPTTILITLYDDVGKIYRYKADGMNDRVGTDLNDHIRNATQVGWPLGDSWQNSSLQIFICFHHFFVPFRGFEPHPRRFFFHEI